MGLLDNVAARLSGLLGGPRGRSENLVQGVLSLLHDPKLGGLSGLVQGFHANGLGEVIESWIGTGPNKPISPEQLGRALGADRLQRLSEATGLSPDVLRRQLVGALPTVIDKLTPRGTMPQRALPDHAGSLIKGKFY
jgi:uncharacterized protein YidB (DUF937 family)